MLGKIVERSLVVLTLCALVAGSCADRGEAPADPGLEETDRVTRLTAKLEVLSGQAASWVSIYDPDRASNGFTLDFFGRTVPILIDMNGEIVHSWPKARVRARLRLLPNGNLLAIGLARSIVEYDWDGNLVWEHKVGDSHPHHDVIRLSNGHTMFIRSRKGEPTDDLVEVDTNGRVIWEWRSAEFLADHFGEQAEAGRDITHVNSLQVLPPNPWFESGDSRFRPGNVLISARNLDGVFLIDRETKQVVWKYDVRLDRQHEAMMIASGSPSQGNILLFNNGLNHRYTDRQSSVIELDPTSNTVVWEYRADDFFSPIVGVQQLLPNGNVLIASSLGPRNFEINKSGEIVWQWTPPFKTKRPTRYPYDYCPQLAALGDRRETPVELEEGYRHIDRHVYRFARSGQTDQVELDGQERRVLLARSSCREILLPQGARVLLAYGVDRTGLLESGRSGYEAEFAASLRILDGGQEIQSLRATIDSGGKSWGSQRWDLQGWAFQWVELCLEDPEIRSADRQIANTHAFWSNPRFSGSTDVAMRRFSKDAVRQELTPEELEVRQEHLKTLGYID